jgi:hypothetical protein
MALIVMTLMVVLSLMNGTLEIITMVLEKLLLILITILITILWF